MKASKLTVRLIALVAYSVASVCLLWLLLGFSSPLTSPLNRDHRPAVDPPRHPPARQLFRQQPASSNVLLYQPPAGIANKFDSWTLKAAGFSPAKPPAPTGDTDAQLSESAAATAAYFDLARRSRLSLTEPQSAEAAVWRRNAEQLRFSFLGRAGRTSCRAGLDRILVAVMTTRGALDRRQAIRKTWASEAETAGVRVVFFLAANENSTISAALAKEITGFGDIVLVPEFEDTYRHLTLKVLSALRFACQLCPGAEMIAKVDDDSVLNLPALRHFWLNRYQSRFPGLQYIAGYMYRAPVVRRVGRWLVATEDYPMSRFPDYMFGGAYVLRVDACQLASAAELFPVLPVEDAFITGILPAALGLHLAAENSGFACQYFNHAGSLNSEAFMRGLVMSATDLTPRRMRGFWRRYQLLMRANNQTGIRAWDA